ncbi:hypothetical protein BDA99DRAFT_512044 [Phascolomyces articulosus]|uniref:Uncharacterized protein n=1 Tax=Phascolomyces articulosus TaxID=60185 RepID=A0AAD5JZK9_9FUNG|nr:hypothetical protein BDA99DRAFT_512044 [Phascolomyces articulosus]
MTDINGNELTRLLSTKPNLYSMIHGCHSLVMKSIDIFENKETGNGFTIMTLTDGTHWVPAVITQQAIDDATKSLPGEFDKNTDTFKDTNMLMLKWMVGMFMRGKALAPYLLIHQLQFTNMASSRRQVARPQDICYHPKVNAWSQEVYNGMSPQPTLIQPEEYLHKSNKEIDESCWYMVLFPKSPQGTLSRDDYRDMYPIFEAQLNTHCGDLPSLEEIANKMKPIKTFKRRRPPTFIREESAPPTKVAKTQLSISPQDCRTLTRGDMMDLFESFDEKIEDIDCIIPKDQKELLSALDGTNVQTTNSVTVESHIETAKQLEHTNLINHESTGVSGVIETSISNEHQDKNNNGVATVNNVTETNREEEKIEEGEDIIEEDQGQHVPVYEQENEEDEDDDLDEQDPLLYWDKMYGSYVKMVNGFSQKLSLLR